MYKLKNKLVQLIELINYKTINILLFRYPNTWMSNIRELNEDKLFNVKHFFKR